MAEAFCPDCEGTGWKTIKRGSVSGVERCECVKEARSARLEEVSGIPPLYQNASFISFQIPTDNDIAARDLSAVKDRVSKYAGDFLPAQPKPGLLLIGDPGSGKTHLAVAALRVIIARGFQGVFYDYQNLIDRIRSGFDPNSGSS